MPTASQVHLDAALTTFTHGYMSQVTKFVSNVVFPLCPVNKQSDKYYVIDPYLEARRAHDDARAPGTEAHEADFEVSSDTYSCNDHAQQSIVADEERDNADAAILPELNKAEFLTNIILLNKDIALAAALQTALATSGTNLTNLTNEWDDYTNGDPVADVRLATTRFIGLAKGLTPNLMVIPYETFLAIKDHPDIVDRVKYTGGTGSTPAMVNAQTLATLFAVDQVVIPQCYKNTAAHKATASMSPIWGENDIYLLYAAPRAGLKVQTMGFTFVWNAGGTAQEGVQVERWREDSRKGDMIRVSFYYDQEIVDTYCGYRIANTRT